MDPQGRTANEEPPLPSMADEVRRFCSVATEVLAEEGLIEPERRPALFARFGRSPLDAMQEAVDAWSAASDLGLAERFHREARTLLDDADYLCSAVTWIARPDLLPWRDVCAVLEAEQVDLEPGPAWTRQAFVDHRFFGVQGGEGEEAMRTTIFPLEEVVGVRVVHAVTREVLLDAGEDAPPVAARWDALGQALHRLGLQRPACASFVRVLTGDPVAPSPYQE